MLGLGVVNDSYTVANTLPNIVYELLLGGVLTSVMVPLLVRAQTEDADGGEAYTRRLLTVAGAALALATLVAMATAPLLTRLYLGDGAGPANPQLATAFAWLLLPQIFFYGLGALLGAMLNTRGVFGPVRLGAGAQQRRRARRARGLRRRARPDQPGPGADGRPQAAGARHRHDARHRRAGAGAAARPCAAPASATARCGAGTGGSPRPAGWPCGWSRYVLIGQPGYIVTTRVAAGGRAGQRRDLLQRLAAAAGALRRARRLAAHRAHAADEPGRRRGPHRATSSPTSRSAPGCPRSCCCRSARC